MRKIIFILGGLTRGGGERVVSNLANYYAEEDLEVEIVTLLNSRVEYELDERIKITSLSEDASRIKQLPKWIKNIRLIVKEGKNPVVISFFSQVNFIVITALVGVQKKLIVSERNDPKNDGRSFLSKILSQFLYLLPHTIVFQTKWAMSQFNYFIRRKAVIVPNPININTLIKSPRTINENKIVAIGRLEEQKDFKFLIKAFKIISELKPDYFLYLYGEGTKEVELGNLIIENNLEETIFLKGNVTNIHEQISDACVMVQTSKFEGLSNSLLECMYIGIPPVVTYYPGLEEVLVSNVNGVITQKSEIRFAEEVIKLVESNEKRKMISINSKQTATNYEINNVIEIWNKVIFGLGEIEYGKL